MAKSKMAYMIKFSSFIINFIEGVITILAIAVIYSFILEADYKDHDVGLGFFVLFIWLILFFVPNIILMFFGKFQKKDKVIFQFIPIFLGAISYTVFQLTV